MRFKIPNLWMVLFFLMCLPPDKVEIAWGTFVTNILVSGVVVFSRGDTQISSIVISLKYWVLSLPKLKLVCEVCTPPLWLILNVLTNRNEWMPFPINLLVHVFRKNIFEKNNVFLSTLRTMSYYDVSRDESWMPLIKSRSMFETANLIINF